MKEADYKAIESALQRMVDLEEDENTKIRESVSALPWPIWSRKMVFFLHKVRGEDGRLWMLQCSVEHPKAPLEPKKFVWNSN